MSNVLKRWNGTGWSITSSLNRRVDGIDSQILDVLKRWNGVERVPVAQVNRFKERIAGIIWDIRYVPVNNQWRSVCYGNGLFVAVSSSGTGNRVMTSG